VRKREEKGNTGWRGGEKKGEVSSIDLLGKKTIAPGKRKREKKAKG